MDFVKKGSGEILSWVSGYFQATKGASIGADMQSDRWRGEFQKQGHLFLEKVPDAESEPVKYNMALADFVQRYRSPSTKLEVLLENENFTAAARETMVLLGMKTSLSAPVLREALEIFDVSEMSAARLGSIVAELSVLSPEEYNALTNDEEARAELRALEKILAVDEDNSLVLAMRNNFLKQGEYDKLSEAVKRGGLALAEDGNEAEARMFAYMLAGPWKDINYKKALLKAVDTPELARNFRELARGMSNAEKFELIYELGKLGLQKYSDPLRMRIYQRLGAHETLKDKIELAVTLGMADLEKLRDTFDQGIVEDVLKVFSGLPEDRKDEANKVALLMSGQAALRPTLLAELEYTRYDHKFDLDSLYKPYEELPEAVRSAAAKLGEGRSELEQQVIGRQLSSSMKWRDLDELSSKTVDVLSSIMKGSPRRMDYALYKIRTFLELRPEEQDNLTPEALEMIRVLTQGHAPTVYTGDINFLYAYDPYLKGLSLDQARVLNSLLFSTTGFHWFMDTWEGFKHMNNEWEVPTAATQSALKRIATVYLNKFDYPNQPKIGFLTSFLVDLTPEQQARLTPETADRLVEVIDTVGAKDARSILKQMIDQFKADLPWSLDGTKVKLINLFQASVPEELVELVGIIAKQQIQPGIESRLTEFVQGMDLQTRMVFLNDVFEFLENISPDTLDVLERFTFNPKGGLLKAEYDSSPLGALLKKTFTEWSSKMSTRESHTDRLIRGFIKAANKSGDSLKTLVDNITPAFVDALQISDDFAIVSNYDFEELGEALALPDEKARLEAAASPRLVEEWEEFLIEEEELEEVVVTAKPTPDPVVEPAPDEPQVVTTLPPNFSPQAYLALHPDLAEGAMRAVKEGHVAKAEDFAIWHFTHHAKIENRIHGVDAVLARMDPWEYARANPDLQTAYGHLEGQAFVNAVRDHYKNNGYNENRRITPVLGEDGLPIDFNSARYAELYPDLVEAFGPYDKEKNDQLYRHHYKNSGCAENRFYR